jgi:hypothetical protein
VVFLISILLFKIQNQSAPQLTYFAADVVVVDIDGAAGGLVEDPLSEALSRSN